MTLEGQNLMLGGSTTINGSAAAMTTTTLCHEDTSEDDGAEGASGLANTKEKTPMCLVNELVRYNKVSPVRLHC